jgi:hypothetical protein
VLEGDGDNPGSEHFKGPRVDGPKGQFRDSAAGVSLYLGIKRVVKGPTNPALDALPAVDGDLVAKVAWEDPKIV